jgi:ElaB/YqjD/DUF883 family membrane-anchored ribosome-binding protein
MNHITNPTTPGAMPGNVYSAATSGMQRNPLEERFSETKERLGEFYEDAREKVTAGARTTDMAVHEHPYYGMGLALGVGVLLGFLISRRGEW